MSCNMSHWGHPDVELEHMMRPCYSWRSYRCLQWWNHHHCYCNNRRRKKKIDWLAKWLGRWSFVDVSRGREHHEDDRTKHQQNQSILMLLLPFMAACYGGDWDRWTITMMGEGTNHSIAWYTISLEWDDKRRCSNAIRANGNSYCMLLLLMWMRSMGRQLSCSAHDMQWDCDDLLLIDEPLPWWGRVHWSVHLNPFHRVVPSYHWKKKKKRMMGDRPVDDVVRTVSSCWCSYCLREQPTIHTLLQPVMQCRMPRRW